VDKYLEDYAEPEVALLDDFPRGYQWRQVVVIPARGEDSGFLRPPPPCEGSCLTVLVINESGTETAQVSLKNKALLTAVRNRCETLWRSTDSSGKPVLYLLRERENGHGFLLVDRFTEGLQLPPKGGVGQARKIGADLACFLINAGYVQSRWVHCTDADARLPDEYFVTSRAYEDIANDLSALVYPYRHVGRPGRTLADVLLATQLYELSLRYYVAGLRYARSPYAFHTIGSTMAISAPHYARVRGFPKRAAAEDFYLLNKLAKVGSVHELTTDAGCGPIELDARLSDRVPFGTGAAVRRLVQLKDVRTDYRFYHPMVFAGLSAWLAALPAIWHSSSATLDTAVFDHDADAYQGFDDHACLLKGLQTLGVNKALQHAFRQSKNLEQFSRQLGTWFDAFRTLKLIHYLRDHGLTPVSLTELQAHGLFNHLLRHDTGLSSFHSGLAGNIFTA
jgi:hypothetical protein